MPGHLDLWILVCSFLDASLAGFVAFECIQYALHSRRLVLWQFISASVLGLGIWSMHFLGMLAWVAPFPLYYALGPTVLSVIIAILASWFAIHLTVKGHSKTPELQLLAGAMLVGVGITGMHYVGMSALRFSPSVQWILPGVLLSYVIAVFASLGAMAMLQQAAVHGMNLKSQTGASLLIGLAICGMHYTGMLSMMLPANAVSLKQPLSFSGGAVARLGVGTATLLILSAPAALLFERRGARRAQLPNETEPHGASAA